MQKLSIFVYLLLWLYCPLQAQEETCPYIQKQDWPGGHQEKLPDFLFMPQLETETIGVSDPGLEPEIAEEQAIQRALFLHSLKKECQLRMLIELFTLNKTATNTSDYEHAKLRSLSRLSSGATRFRFSVEEKYTSAYKEVYIKLAIKETGEECRTLSSKCEIMYSLNQESHEQEELLLNLSIQCDDSSGINNHFFSLKGNKEKLYLASRLNDTDITIKTNLFRYLNLDKVVSDKQGYSLSNAFWSAMMESLIDDITGFQAPGLVIKHVNEHYNDSNRAMSRAIINKRISVLPTFHTVDNNRLIIDWSITSLEQHNTSSK